MSLSPGDMLEMQILGPHCRPIESEAEGRAQQSFTNPPGDSDAH